jgi:hypothetical protein
MLQRVRLLILTAIIIFLVSGCATTGSKSNFGAETPRALDVSTVLKFEDIPVPSGFKAVVNESFTFQNEVLRAGVLKYSGRANGEQVLNFYKDQMPLYRWKLLNILEYGKRILNFDRDDQTCIIVIEPTSLGTAIIITVGPKAGRASVYKSSKEEDDEREHNTRK